MLTQKDIDQMSDSLRAQGLTWNQTNYAVSLVRNAIDTEREACAKGCEQLSHIGSENQLWMRDRCAAFIRSRSNTK